MQRTLLYPCLAIAALLAGACASENASPTSPSSVLPGDSAALHGPKPPKPPPPPPPAEESISVVGTVLNYGTGPKGEINKFFLRDGAGVVWDVRFPPHEASRVQALAPAGDQNIKVDGIKRTDPEGRTHIDARTLTDLDDGQSISLGGPAPPPPPPPPGETFSATGTVLSYGTGPKGEVNKFFLRDGAGVVWEVRFPPHEASRVQAVAPAGDANIKVDGDKRTDPDGNTHINAKRITDLDDGQSITLGP